MQVSLGPTIRFEWQLAFVDCHEHRLANTPRWHEIKQVQMILCEPNFFLQVNLFAFRQLRNKLYSHNAITCSFWTIQFHIV